MVAFPQPSVADALKFITSPTQAGVGFPVAWLIVIPGLFTVTLTVMVAPVESVTVPVC
jgi:hypothetical protein